MSKKQFWRAPKGSDPGGWLPIFYLWHLEQIGVIQRNDDQLETSDAPQDKSDDEPEEYKPGTSYSTPYWSETLIGSNSTVAIIDSGCTTRHPNLPEGAIKHGVDMALMPLGGVYSEKAQKEILAKRKAGRKKLDQILASLPDQTDAVVLKKIADELADEEPEYVVTQDPANNFAGHGTACAGLVAGRLTAKGKDQATVLPYYGVNPFATIVPIATPYSHEIRPIIAALMHAVMVKADVILMPRAVNDLLLDATRDGASDEEVPEKSWKAPALNELRATRLDYDGKLKLDKRLFVALLQAVAAWRPVVLAAGNEGLSAPTYPASLVNQKTNPLANAIIVGAVNAAGEKSSYSNGTPETGVTVYAPSDDEERIDQAEGEDPFVLFDLAGPEAAWIRPQKFAEKAKNTYLPYSVLAIDVPARTLPDANPQQVVPTRALYSSFGGTSAASSIVAGALSLVQATRREAKQDVLTGIEMRECLDASLEGHEGLPVLDMAKLMQQALAR